MKHRPIALAGAACLLATLPGCGGGGGQSTDLSPRLAGIYHFTLSTGERISANVPGTSPTFSGAGTTTGNAAPQPYTYNGTLNRNGGLDLTVRLGGRTVSGHVNLALLPDATASGSLAVTDSQLTQPISLTIERAYALPVADGPVNSLIGLIDPALPNTPYVSGVAVSPDGRALFASVGSNLYRIPTSGTPSFTLFAADAGGSNLALSGDSHYLYGWTGLRLKAVGLSDGVVTDVAPLRSPGWLTVPRSATAGSMVFFGDSRRSHRATLGTAPEVTDLANPLSQMSLLGAVAPGDGNQLLELRAPGAATPPAYVVSLNVAGGNVAVTKLLDLPLGAIPHFALMPDDTTLVVGTAETPAAVVFASLAAGGGTVRVPIGSGQLRGLGVSPDGRRVVAVTSLGPRAYVIDADRRSVLQVIDISAYGGANGAVQVAFTPDSSRAYISGQTQIAVIRLK